MKSWLRAGIVVGGIVAIQFAIFGSSLLGRTILLPLDLMAGSSGSSGGVSSGVHDPLLTDPITQFELMRRFAVSEVRAGRLPSWDPHDYCGAPFLANNQSAVFSPFRLIDYAWPSPRALAWVQMLKALVGGIGAYLFFRRAIGARFEASAMGAWIWPINGFLISWAMWPMSATVEWLPWIMLGVDRIVRIRRGRWVALLAIVTGCMLVSGHSEAGAQALIVSGVYALWLIVRRQKGFVRPSLLLIAGWALGMCLAAPQLLPTMRYMRECLRLPNRIARGQETRPMGLAAAPQLVMPWVQGSTRSGSVYLLDDSPLESPIGGYVGLIAVLVLAPFGLADRRRRTEQIFWLAIALLGAAYLLDLPGAAAINSLPGLRVLRANRMIMATAFALLTASVIGLDVLLRRRPVRRAYGLLIAPGICILLAIWCTQRAVRIDQIIAHKWGAQMAAARNAGFSQRVDRIIEHLRQTNLFYAALCAAAAALGLWLWYRPGHWLVRAVALAAVVEVVLSARGVNPASDPSLYKPDLPEMNRLAQLASVQPGRACGVRCFQPMLLSWWGLSDIRGYDGADPRRALQFLRLFEDPDVAPPSSYSLMDSYVPKLPSPLADFVNLRYLIYPRARPEHLSQATIVGEQFYVVENPSAMPRVSVPRQAVVIPDETTRLRALAEPTFDPRRTVVLEKPISLPDSMSGEARIVNELPSQVEIDYDTKTAGLVVLADSWDPGWSARLAAGQPLEVLRANHNFRAVVVPAGTGRIIFDYWPAGLTTGLCLAVAAALLLLLARCVLGGRRSF